MVKPFISYLIATPSTIDKGNNSILTWSSIGGDTVTLTDFGDVTNTGSRTVSPSSTKTYTLTATNSEGTATKSVTVTVRQPEPPPPPPPPPPEETHTLTVYTTPAECGVSVWSTDDFFIGAGGTGSDGKIVFTDIEDGRYKIKISKEGYNFATRTVNIYKDMTERFTIKEEGPWDWLLGVVIEGFESVIGWVSGSFIDTISSFKSFMDNLTGDIYDFFADPIGNVISWVQDNAGDLFDWLTGGLTDLFDWLSKLTGDAFENIKTFFGDIADFVGDKFTSFIDWIVDLSGSVADYIGGAISDFVDWTSEQLGSIWEGIQTWFLDAIEGFVDAFFGGLDDGIEEAKGSPLHSDEPVGNPVLNGLRKVVREHRKKYNRDPVTGEK